MEHRLKHALSEHRPSMPVSGLVPLSSSCWAPGEAASTGCSPCFAVGLGAASPHHSAFEPRHTGFLVSGLWGPIQAWPNTDVGKCFLSHVIEPLARQEVLQKEP